MELLHMKMQLYLIDWVSSKQFQIAHIFLYKKPIYEKPSSKDSKNVKNLTTTKCTKNFKKLLK